MTQVPRRARQIPDQPGTVLGDPKPLQSFRDLPAWVLLGEPGAGKTTALQMEAKDTGGKFLRIAEFIHSNPDDESRAGPLFLDGLDEVRAGAGEDSVLLRVRATLKRLGYPRFRIACRAADWYGASDADDLNTASGNGQIVRLQLESLGEDDILTLLRDNPGIDPRAFVKKATQLGVADLLGNPQTLGLLAEAVRDGNWPQTREATYRLACEKLAEDANKRHRDLSRDHPRSVESILDAAGQLCAVLLLSDKTGIALDSDRSAQGFVYLNECAPPDIEASTWAVHSRLFLPEGEERVVPSHRSVAEYLASRWLAARIDGEGLPLGRVMSLLLGRDGRTIAGLRGLYAWLALHCQSARARLIEADPLTVILYGDVRPMLAQDKRHLLAGLRKEAERYPGFRWDAHTAHPFGALVDPDLRDAFLAALRAPERDRANQAYLLCVLDSLYHGVALVDLAEALRAIVRDDSYRSDIRRSALSVWLNLAADPQAAISLLDEVSAGRVADHNDGLAGTLLRHLYPKQIGSEALLRYLHEPKDPSWSGIYQLFLFELPQVAPEEHLPVLLDGLVGRQDLQGYGAYRHSLGEMADKLLARGVTAWGDKITDECLFTWLGIGVDEYGRVTGEKAALEAISGWIGARPERHKALLFLGFARCAGDEHPPYCIHVLASRLRNAPPPADLGAWHLEQVDRTENDALARLHLEMVVAALVNQRGTAGLSLEQIEDWAIAHPERRHWLEPMLAWEIPAWRSEQATTHKTQEQEGQEVRRQRAKDLQRHLPQIRAGTAPAVRMHQLARVWMGFDTHGNTPADRFDNYVENGRELLAFAEAGFPRCPEREDLPSVEEIIDLATKQREHFIGLPCLVGMDLRGQGGTGEIDSLPKETLRRMVAFRLTHGADKTPEWLTHLVRQRPALVAEVLTSYAGAALKAKKELVDGIYPLEHDPEYRAVAAAAVPTLLAAFPARARVGQLRYLEHLLKAALRDAPKQLAALIGKKLSMKGMDAAQKVYWLAAGILTDSHHYEAALSRHIGRSEVRANHLSRFFSGRHDASGLDWEPSAGVLGKVIELIAPHADWPSGGAHWGNDAMRRGDHVRALVNRLSAMATIEAEQEIDRLLGLSSLHKLKRLLEAARHELKQRKREREFEFLSARDVAQVLANQAPASVADLAALVLDHLGDIARDIRQENDDGFRAFWNTKGRNPDTQKVETLCRDLLLTRLRARLAPLGVDCQPEGDYANDKRADLRVSYRAEFELPIEIKRNRNSEPSLWRALRTQLIAQYSGAPKAHGFGVYLVLWFGGEGMPRATDGGKKPRSPEELRTRLEAQLDPMERRRIFVRVLDVSSPTAAGDQ